MSNFTPTQRRYFTVESGKLLIADPFKLGYDTKTEREMPISSSHLNFLPYGFLFLNTDRDGVGQEDMYAVSRIADNIFLENEEKINNTLDKRHVTLENFFQERRGRPFLFRAGLDSCILLVGDVERYGVEAGVRKTNFEEKWRRFYDERLKERPDLTKEAVEEAIEKEIKKMVTHELQWSEELLNEQVLEVSPGDYKATFNMSKRLVTVKRIDRNRK